MNRETRPRTRALVPSARAVVALLLTLGGLAVGSSRPLAAQDAPARDEVLSALFASLEPSTDLRLITLGGAVEEGTLQGVGPASIDLAGSAGTVPIGYDFVRSVSVQGGHGVQGAIWGFGGGALAGALFGMMYASFDCTNPSDCGYTETQGALRWGAFVGVLGGGLGFYFGSHQVHWHPIFP